eukprot:6182249-Amphidinium_carterae.1
MLETLGLLSADWSFLEELLLYLKRETSWGGSGRMSAKHHREQSAHHLGCHIPARETRRITRVAVRMDLYGGTTHRTDKLDTTTTPIEIIAHDSTEQKFRCVVVTSCYALSMLKQGRFDIVRSKLCHENKNYRVLHSAVRAAETGCVGRIRCALLSESPRHTQSHAQQEVRAGVPYA